MTVIVGREFFEQFVETVHGGDSRVQFFFDAGSVDH